MADRLAPWITRSTYSYDVPVCVRQRNEVMKARLKLAASIRRAYRAGRIVKDSPLGKLADGVFEALTDKNMDPTRALRFHLGLDIEGSQDSEMVTALAEVAAVVPRLKPLAAHYHPEGVTA